jgi:hypothetical protein
VTHKLDLGAIHIEHGAIHIEHDPPNWIDGFRLGHQLPIEHGQTGEVDGVASAVPPERL